jgi:hypothetical protein
MNGDGPIVLRFFILVAAGFDPISLLAAGSGFCDAEEDKDQETSELRKRGFDSIRLVVYPSVFVRNFGEAIMLEFTLPTKVTSGFNFGGHAFSRDFKELLKNSFSLTDEQIKHF